MSVALEVTFDRPDLGRLAASIREGIPELLEGLAGEVESQTRRRISETATDPDGIPWPEWADSTKRRRHAGQSLLQMQGDLLDSIQSTVDGEDVLVGSNLKYAATQQFGSDDDGRNIPARAYLGIGAGDVSELEAVIDDWLGSLV